MKVCEGSPRTPDFYPSFPSTSPGTLDVWPPPTHTHTLMPWYWAGDEASTFSAQSRFLGSARGRSDWHCSHPTCLGSLSVSTLLEIGKPHLPLSKFSIYWSGWPGWLISVASVVVLPKGLREEVEEKPIKAHPEQQGNSTQLMSSSFHTRGRWLALWWATNSAATLLWLWRMTQWGLCQSPCKCQHQPLPSAKGQQVSPLTFGVYRCKWVL